MTITGPPAEDAKALDAAKVASDTLVEIQESTRDSDGALAATITSVGPISSGGYLPIEFEFLAPQVEASWTWKPPVPTPWEDDCDLARFIRGHGASAGALDDLIGRRAYLHRVDGLGDNNWKVDVPEPPTPWRERVRGWVDELADHARVSPGRVLDRYPLGAWMATAFAVWTVIFVIILGHDVPGVTVGDALGMWVGGGIIATVFGLLMAIAVEIGRMEMR